MSNMFHHDEDERDMIAFTERCEAAAVLNCDPLDVDKAALAVFYALCDDEARATMDAPGVSALGPYTIKAGRSER